MSTLDVVLVNELSTAAMNQANVSDLIQIIRSHFQLTGPERFPVITYISQVFDIPLASVSKLGAWQGFGDADARLSDEEVDAMFSRDLANWRKLKSS